MQQRSVKSQKWMMKFLKLSRSFNILLAQYGWERLPLFFLLKSNPCKTEQLLQEIELQQKKPDKDGKHIEKPIRNNPNIKGTC